MNDNDLSSGSSVNPGNLFNLWLSHTSVAENTLKAQLANILLLSEDAIISISPGQEIVLFNPAAECMFGYEAYEVLGKPIDLLLPSRFIQVHRQHVRDFIASPDVIRPMHQRGDIFGLRKDGTEFPAEASISKSALGNEIMLVVRMRDISERKRAEAAMLSVLSHTQELYEFSRQIGSVSTLSELLQTLLANQHFHACNRAGILVFDRPWADHLPLPQYIDLLASVSKDDQFPALAGLRYPIVMTWLIQSGIRNKPIFVDDVATEPGLPDRAREALLALGVHSFALFALKAVGECYGLLALQFTSASGFNAEDGRHVEGLIDQAAVAIRNIRLLEAEAHARREAERANEQRLRFLAMISHELRTPLTSIKGFITTLLAEDVTWDDQSQREFLNIANQESDKLTEMIDQLLDLSRMEAGMLNIQLAPRTVNEIMTSCMAQLLLITSQHRLVIRVPDTLPPVAADRQRIAQVLTNLVGNAAKYSPAGCDITVSAMVFNEFVQVSVADRGPGTSSEDRLHLFEPFRRGEDSLARRTKGAGLGLAICKGLVEAHGGRIWMEDHAGGGTVVSFTLPVSKDTPT